MLSPPRTQAVPPPRQRRTRSRPPGLLRPRLERLLKQAPAQARACPVVYSLPCPPPSSSTPCLPLPGCPQCTYPGMPHYAAGACAWRRGGVTQPGQYAPRLPASTRHTPFRPHAPRADPGATGCQAAPDSRIVAPAAGCPAPGCPRVASSTGPGRRSQLATAPRRLPPPRLVCCTPGRTRRRAPPSHGGAPNTQHGPVCRPLAGHHHSPAHNPLASPAHNCVPNALARRTDRAAAHPWVSGARTWPGAAHPCPCLQQARASCQPRARCPLKPPSPGRHVGPALRPAAPSSPHPPGPLPTSLVASLFTAFPFNPSSTCVPGQPPMYVNGHPKRNCTGLASRLLNPTLHRAGWLPAVTIPAPPPPPTRGAPASPALLYLPGLLASRLHDFYPTHRRSATAPCPLACVAGRTASLAPTYDGIYDTLWLAALARRPSVAGGCPHAALFASALCHEQAMAAMRQLGYYTAWLLTVTGLWPRQWSQWGPSDGGGRGGTW